MAYYEKLLQAAEYLRSRMPFAPKVGIVLGSGLGGLADRLENPGYGGHAGALSLL